MTASYFGTGLYSPRIAARIARIRYQNFQAWAKANLLHPLFEVQVGRRQERIYSYRNLLLIRLIVRLRERGFQTREIKRALDVITLMSGGDPNGWMRATLYVDGRLIVAMIPERPEWNPVATSKGPQKMALVFFPKLIQELERELVPNRFHHVEVNPRILGGAPVIKGTRIPTQAIVELIQAGQDPKFAYPMLTDDHINEAKAYEDFLEAA